MSDKTSQQELERRFEFAPDKHAQQTGIDLWSMSLRFKWLLLIGAIGGGVLAQLAYQKLGPTYSAESRILVSKTADVPLDKVDEVVREGRGEHIALIMSPMIVDRAIEMGKLDKLPSFINEDDPAEIIVEDLKVNRSAGKEVSFLNVLDLIYINPNRNDAREVVTYVIAAYEEYLKTASIAHSDDSLELITTAVADVQKKLREKENEYLEFQRTAPLIRRIIPGTEANTVEISTVHQHRMTAIENERQKVMLLAADLKTKQSTLQAAVQRGVPQQDLEVMVRSFLEPGSGGGISADILNTQGRESADLDARLLPLLLKEKQLMRDFGPDYYELQETREQIQTVIQFYKKRGVELPNGVAEPRRRKQPSEVNLVNIYLQALGQKLQAIDSRLTQLDDLYVAEGLADQKLLHFRQEEMEFTEALAKLKALNQTVVSRMNEYNIIKDKEGYRLKRISPVRTALVLKRQIKFLGAGLIGGAVCVLGLLYLREFRDTSLKSIDELRTRLELPILGGVPKSQLIGASENAPLERKRMHPGLVYFHQPGSAAAEAYRSVRTALFASAAVTGGKVFVFTSPEPGDGKSTLISNLAIAMAQVGKKVLLVDADMRKPTIHELFGNAHDIGTSDVLRGEINFENAVQPSIIPNLTLLTTGQIPNNPAELLSTNKFNEMIKQVRNEYDIVLIDSPPLLVVSDPAIIAPQTDGLLLVIRLQKNKRAATTRAQELIETLGVDTLGVIANGMPNPENEFGYAKYNIESSQPKNQPTQTVESAKPTVTTT